MVAEGGEGENPLPFSLIAQNAGGVGGVSRPRFPPGPHLRSSRFSRHPRLRQAPTRRFAKNRNLRGLGRSSISAAGPGPKLPGLLHRLISCAQSLQPSLTFLLRRNNKGSQNPRPSMLMRIGHVCNNNAVLVLHSPGNLACCAD